MLRVRRNPTQLVGGILYSRVLPSSQHPLGILLRPCYYASSGRRWERPNCHSRAQEETFHLPISWSHNYIDHSRKTNGIAGKSAWTLTLINHLSRTSVREVPKLHPPYPVGIYRRESANVR